MHNANSFCPALANSRYHCFKYLPYRKVCVIYGLNPNKKKQYMYSTIKEPKSNTKIFA